MPTTLLKFSLWHIVLYLGPNLACVIVVWIQERLSLCLFNACLPWSHIILLFTTVQISLVWFYLNKPRVQLKVEGMSTTSKYAIVT